MLDTQIIADAIRSLSAPDPAQRRAAAESLAGGDERALYPLIRALRDENAGVQDAAMRALIAIGGEVTAHMVMPLLREGPLVRNTAIIILREIGPGAVPLLRPLLSDKDDDVRKFALDLITDIRECAYPDDIVRLLEADPNPNVRASAARVLGILGRREALPSLFAALRDEEWVCFMTLEALAAIGEPGSAAQVGQLLSHPSDTVRYAAIETLGKLGAAEGAEALTARLAAASEMEKTAIVKSLVQIGALADSDGARDVLRRMLREGDWDDRMIALRGLTALRETGAVPAIVDLAGSLEPSDPENEERLLMIRDALLEFGAGPLLPCLDDDSIRYRGKVITAEILGELRAVEAVPQLVALLDKDVRDVRRASARALAEIATTEAVDVLRDAVEDHDGHVRRAALASLGMIGDRSSLEPIVRMMTAERYDDVMETAVQAALAVDGPGLFRRLTDLPPRVREAAARHARDTEMLLRLSEDPEPLVRASALGSLAGARDSRAADRLAAALSDERPEVRSAALRGLGERRCCLPAVTAALRDPELWVRVAAVRALAEFPADEAVPGLSTVLDDDQPPAILAAVESLARFKTKDAQLVLRALRGHRDEAVRAAAARALEAA